MNKTDYAVFVATVSLVWNICKWGLSRARLRLSIAHNREIPCFHIKVINIGDRKTKITSSAFLYYNNWRSKIKSMLPLIQHEPDKCAYQKDSPFPRDIESGEGWTTVISDKEIQDFPENGLLYYALYESHKNKNRPKTIKINNKHIKNLT